jgi:Pyruvate/2-oxoacid:ferredoxin oxidoreductase gamma subunit
VRLAGRGGQGVIVPGRTIVTAAHCIQWDADGRMAFGDPDYEEIIVGGRRVLTEVYAVEPIADIAVLGAVDGQPSEEMYEAWNEYDRVLDSIRPVPGR